MLKPAILYEEELKRLYRSIAFEEKYKFYHADCYLDLNVGISKSTWDKIQMVSIDKDESIIGFLSADIHRGDSQVSSLAIINFRDLNYTFSKDLHQFLIDLLTKFNFRKISFSVVVGNPAEKMYDKYINRYNGRIVGTYKQDVKLFDGKYYDLKLYEIFRNDFLQAKERYI